MALALWIVRGLTRRIKGKDHLPRFTLFSLHCTQVGEGAKSGTQRRLAWTTEVELGKRERVGGNGDNAEECKTFHISPISIFESRKGKFRPPPKLWVNNDQPMTVEQTLTQKLLVLLLSTRYQMEVVFPRVACCQDER